MKLKRTVLKQEIAIKLYPDSISEHAALQHLRREINTNPEIKSKISKAGYTRKHYYNKQQLEIILTHLCVSMDEFEQL